MNPYTPSFLDDVVELYPRDHSRLSACVGGGMAAAKCPTKWPNAELRAYRLIVECTTSTVELGFGKNARVY